MYGRKISSSDSQPISKEVKAFILNHFNQFTQEIPLTQTLGDAIGNGTHPDLHNWASALVHDLLAEPDVNLHHDRLVEYLAQQLSFGMGGGHQVEPIEFSIWFDFPLEAQEELQKFSAIIKSCFTREDISNVITTLLENQEAGHALLVRTFQQHESVSTASTTEEK